MVPIQYDELRTSFQSAADRAWYFTAFQHDLGSQAMPVTILNALGATPRGNGTYCWTDGDSEIWVYGSFNKHPGAYALDGTICVSKVHYTVSSPSWSYDPHYDYNKIDEEHDMAHLHPNSTEKWSMDDCPEKVLDYLVSGVSQRFACFLEEMKEQDIDIFHLEDPTPL